MAHNDDALVQGRLLHRCKIADESIDFVRLEFEGRHGRMTDADAFRKRLLRRGDAIAP